jgi:hypothetical protein
MPRLPVFDRLSKQKATLEDLKTAVERAESAPVLVSAGHLDADARSITRMRQVLRLLKSQPNRLQVRWTMADDTTVVFTPSEFEAMVNEAQDVYTARLLDIHTRARQLKNQRPVISLRELANEVWPS